MLTLSAVGDHLPSHLPARIASLAAGAIGTLPDAAVGWLGGSWTNSTGDHLSPDIALALRAAGVLADRDSAKTLGASRAGLRRLTALAGGVPAPVDVVRPLRIDTSSGDIGARLYIADGEAGELGMIVYFHGGGWCLGGLDTADTVCRILARRSGKAVLSVDYRLAPEHRFPAAVDDAREAFLFARSHAAAWGVGTERIGVGGDSAGANLAAVTANELSKHPDIRPAFAFLLYPVCDLTQHTESYREFSHGPQLTAERMDFFTRHYLWSPDLYGDPRVSPLLAPDLASTPPTFIATAGFDPLHDEAVAYARALSAAGAHVQLERFGTLPHGFANMTGISSAARSATWAAADALREL